MRTFSFFDNEQCASKFSALSLPHKKNNSIANKFSIVLFCTSVMTLYIVVCVSQLAAKLANYNDEGIYIPFDPPKKWS